VLQRLVPEISAREDLFPSALKVKTVFRSESCKKGIFLKLAVMEQGKTGHAIFAREIMMGKVGEFLFSVMKEIL